MKKITRAFLFFFFSLVLLILFIHIYMPRFLSHHKPVDSKNYLIEAWISAYEVEQAARYFGSDPDALFYVIGASYSEDMDGSADRMRKSDSDAIPDMADGIWLYSDISLGFGIPKNLKLPVGDTLHIDITAKGQESSGYFAGFNLIINGKCIGSSFTTEEYQLFSFRWIVSEKGLKSLFIRFNNDHCTNFSDRNLNIKSVKINDRYLTPLNLMKNAGVLSTGFNSRAAETANYLINIGVDQKKIRMIHFDPVDRNQTLRAAQKFKDFNSELKISGINIISTKNHSRRTWITYKKLLHPDTRVGIVYFTTPNNNNKIRNETISGFFNLLDEFFSYLTTWFMLTF